MIEFAPVEAERLRLLFPAGGPEREAEISSLRVYEAPGASLVASSIAVADVGPAPPDRGPDLARPDRGARAFAHQGTRSGSSPQDLVDGDASTAWVFDPARGTAVLRFAGGRPVRIGGVRFELESGSEGRPLWIELASAAEPTTEAGAYRTFAHVLVPPAGEAVFRPLEPLEAGALAVRVRRIWRGEEGRIRGLSVHEAPGTRPSILERVAAPTAPDTVRGFDLAAPPLGGRLAGEPKFLNDEHRPSNLLDASSGTRGWLVRSSDLPQDVVVAFREPAVVDRVFLDMRYLDDSGGGAEYSPAARMAELELAAAGGPEGPFEPIGTYFLPDSDRFLLVRFEPRRAGALRLRFLANHGHPSLAGLNHVRILEAPGPSVLDGVPRAVSDRHVGGAVVRFTS